MAFNLHLKIFSADVHEAAVGQPITKISGQVNARVSAVWVGQKFTTSKLGLLPIAERKIRASYGNFSDLVRPQFCPGFTQQQNFVPLQRITDRNSGLFD